MKRFFLLIALAAVLLTSACGREATVSPGFSDEDLYLNISGERYELKVNIDSVITALGSDYAYSEAISCDYDGLDKVFIYDIAQFYTFPLPEGDLVSEIYTDNSNVSASRGICIGALSDEVLAAYGAGEDTGYQIIYRTTGGNSLCFDIENSTVTAIYITTQPV